MRRIWNESMKGSPKLPIVGRVLYSPLLFYEYQQNVLALELQRVAPEYCRHRPGEKTYKLILFITLEYSNYSFYLLKGYKSSAVLITVNEIILIVANNLIVFFYLFWELLFSIVLQLIVADVPGGKLVLWGEFDFAFDWLGAFDVKFSELDCEIVAPFVGFLELLNVIGKVYWCAIAFERLLNPLFQFELLKVFREILEHDCVLWLADHLRLKICDIISNQRFYINGEPKDTNRGHHVHKLCSSSLSLISFKVYNRKTEKAETIFFTIQSNQIVKTTSRYQKHKKDHVDNVFGKLEV